MPAAIATFDLGWSTLKGGQVFANLTLSFNAERIAIIGRNRVGKTSLLKLLSGERESTSGKIMRRGSIAVLRQIVQVAPGETIADQQ